MKFDELINSKLKLYGEAVAATPVTNQATGTAGQNPAPAQPAQPAQQTQQNNKQVDNNTFINDFFKKLNDQNFVTALKTAAQNPTNAQMLNKLISQQPQQAQM